MHEPRSRIPSLSRLKQQYNKMLFIYFLEDRENYYGGKSTRNKGSPRLKFAETGMSFAPNTNLLSHIACSNENFCLLHYVIIFQFLSGCHVCLTSLTKFYVTVGIIDYITYLLVHNTVEYILLKYMIKQVCIQKYYCLTYKLNIEM